MKNPCNEQIRGALRMARELMKLAGKGDERRNDDGCGVLFGVVRDCAYKVRKHAELERAAHEARGQWEGRDATQPLHQPIGSHNPSRRPERK